jgi:DNA repair exonuclease SbcCD nuclease subunit
MNKAGPMPATSERGTRSSRLRHSKYPAVLALGWLLALWSPTPVPISARDSQQQVPEAPEIQLPLADGSTRFAVIGDSGTGKREQYQVAALMNLAHDRFPFDFVIMCGDNIYGSENPEDYVKKFDRPYRPLLDKGVKFYASLGNHDSPNQRFYKDFNMSGKRYYSFRYGRARFFALDTTYMDREQLEWVEKELNSANEPWKICFFHHPLYSSGMRHGASVQLRIALEPLFLAGGVDAVFSGHEHFYERISPQKGIYYFISGAAGQLRFDNIKSSQITAKGFARDRHFILVEITADRLYYQTVSRAGKTVDSGHLQEMERTAGAKTEQQNGR